MSNNVIKLCEKEFVRVTVYKEYNQIGVHNLNFESISSIKKFIKEKYCNNGKLCITIYQPVNVRKIIYLIT